MQKITQEKGVSVSASLSAPATSSSSPSFSLERLSRDIEDAFDDCGEGFISVASEAVDILVLQIMTVMQGPIQALFTPAWLDDPTVSQDLTTTLKDFFDDLHAWISRDAYFSRVIRLCLHSLCQEYARRLIEARPPLSAEFFERLKGDQILLDSFFISYSELVEETYVTSELSFIQLIQETLQADVDSLELHFNKMMDTWPGEVGVKVIDTLLNLRADLGRGQRKAVVELYSQHLKREKERKMTVGVGVSGGGVSGDSGGVVDLTESSSGRGSSSSFVSPNTGLWSLFQSRVRPVSKGKPSQRRGKQRKQRKGDGGETINLEDFLK